MLRKVSAFLSLVVMVFCATASLHAQSAKAIEAGKKEGKAVAYGSLESDNMDAVVQGFQKKTGIRSSTGGHRRPKSWIAP